VLETDPFAILGIEPTLDRHAVKLAYFAAIRRTPPHADPEGFKRIRGAYEELSDESRLRRACLRAPLEATLLERWNARFKLPIDEARVAHSAGVARARTLELFIERCARIRVGDRAEPES
jgi:hypothetical protein